MKRDLRNVYSSPFFQRSYSLSPNSSALKVLMWKHFKERRRKLFHTFWEIVSGVLIFLIVLTSKMYYNALIEASESSDAKTVIDELLYSPNNNLTQSYVARLRNELNFTVESGLSGITAHRGFNSNKEVLNYIRALNISKTIAIVNFNNFNKRVLPDQLNYSIGVLTVGNSNRIKHHLGTNFVDTFSLEDRTPTYLRKLQWAIDKVFLEFISGEQNIMHDLQLHAITNVKDVFLQLIMYGSLSIYSMLAPLPFFLINSSRMLNLRRTGLKELLKMVGVSPHIARLSHLLDTAVLATVYAILVTIVLKVTSEPILKNSNVLILVITLILQLIVIKALAFVTSTLSQDYEHASSLDVLIYLVTVVVDTPWLCHRIKCTPYVYILCLIFPHLPMNLFWYEITFLERIGEGTNFYNMFKRNSTVCFSVIMVWIFFALQVLLMSILAWYLELVRPGRYGMAEKWNFLCNKRFWRPKKKHVNFHVTAEQNLKVLRDDRFFEKAPLKTEIAVKVAKVTKIFKTFRQPDVVALDDVTLDFYNGEITVLLGVNGAGKTTLLSIITGMYSPTSGKVYVKGLDMVKRIQEIRKDIAFCPQHNLTFDYLTVRENIALFQTLRGIDTSARPSLDKLLTKLNLIGKADCYSYQLPAGLKRCLQVACALACGADVLVLDEPTSGMDSISRHALWDMLLILRGHITILMTTTFLREADVLGDRIALLVEGKLKCYGTPTFLKNAIGAGFSLSLTLKSRRKIAELQEVVQSTIPLTTFRPLGKMKVVFTLPVKDRELFPKLFDLLEEKKTELNIAAIEVGMSVEEVFMEFIYVEDEPEAFFLTTRIDSTEDVKLKGFQLHTQQILVLLKRIFKFLMTKRYYFIIFQVLIPIVIIVCGTIQSNGIDTEPEFFNKRTNLYYNMGQNRRSAVIEPIKRSHPHIKAFESSNVLRDIDGILNNSDDEKTPQLVGVEMVANGTRILIPIQSDFAVSNAVNLFSNMYMSLHMPYVNSSIHTTYARYRMDEYMTYPKGIISSYIWTLVIMFFVTLILTPFVWLSIREHNSGVRYNHVIAGCPPIVHWTAKLAFHMILYVTIVPVTVFLASVYLENNNTINDMRFLGAMIIILMLFGPAFLMHLYALSFVLREEHAVSYIYNMSLWFGVVSPILRAILLDLSDVGYSWLRDFTTIVSAINHISPVFTLEYGLLDLIAVGRKNAYCRLNKHLCPNITVPDLEGMTSMNKTCCESSSSQPFNYYESFKSSFWSLIILLLQTVVYFIILQLLQNRVIQKFLESILSRNYIESEPRYKNPDVIREMEYVKEKMQLLKERGGKEIPTSNDALIVHNMHKNFLGLNELQYQLSAVRGVSFAVKKGECLGILGAIGSGKSSVMYMITGFCVKTRGDAWAGGYFLDRDKSKYIHKIALATSFGIDEFLSGFENLTLISELHGRPVRQAERFAINCLNFMGLQSLTHVRSETYSMGCVQRLAVCGALLVEPLAALFDEPSSAVDPRTRPLVVRALKHIVQTGKAVVLTEHSMDWQLIEMICNRIAIMSRGELAAIGSTQSVRSALASGYTARLKLCVDTVLEETITDSEDSVKSQKGSVAIKPLKIIIHRAGQVENLKSAFEKEFQCVLMTEHLTSIYYHIIDDTKTLLYSTMFTKLEHLKSTFNEVLEDYTLCETSIEEVFRRIERQET